MDSKEYQDMLSKHLISVERPKSWGMAVADCIEDESKRYMLKVIPTVLIASTDIVRDAWDWLDYFKAMRN